MEHYTDGLTSDCGSLTCQFSLQLLFTEQQFWMILFALVYPLIILVTLITFILSSCHLFVAQQLVHLVSIVVHYSFGSFEELNSGAFHVLWFIVSVRCTKLVLEVCKCVVWNGSHSLHQPVLSSFHKVTLNTVINNLLIFLTRF